MSEWISVKKQLPEKHQVVALLNNDRWMNSPAHEPQGLHWYGVGSINDQYASRPYWEVIGECAAWCLDSVTHWMPLPPPAEGE